MICAQYTILLIFPSHSYLKSKNKCNFEKSYHLPQRPKSTILAHSAQQHIKLAKTELTCVYIKLSIDIVNSRQTLHNLFLQVHIKVQGSL